MSSIRPSKVLILGGRGQMGRALQESARVRKQSAVEIVSLDRSHGDFGDRAVVLKMLEDCKANWIINVAAYNQVDKAETDDGEAMRINAELPRVLAEHCARAGAALIHFSTDYVYSGEGDRPWKESDPTHPLNRYGMSKKRGEDFVLQSGCRGLIFRTSWVYDAYGNNFPNKILANAQKAERLSIVDDQIGAPCYAPILAEATWQALAAWESRPELAQNSPARIYHLVQSGETSWYAWASELIEAARGSKLGPKIILKEMKPVKTAEFGAPALRPLNSRLDARKIAQELGITIPDWRVGFQAWKEIVLGHSRDNFRVNS